MIPKIVHYTWFGRGPIPADQQAWIEEWKRRLPDYEFRLWNEDNFDIALTPYVREAYLSRNYAFVSDVCRIHALLTCGGIYLDTDVELLKSFDPYLHHRSFCSWEGSRIGMSIMGAQKGEKWLQLAMDYYRKRHFINSFGHPVRTPITRTALERWLPLVDEADRPEIYPMEVFGGVQAAEGGMTGNDATVAVHHFNASWRKHRTLPQRIRIILQGLKIRYLSR